MADDNLVRFIPAACMIKREVEKQESSRRIVGDISPEEAQALPRCGICEHHVKISSPAACYDDQGRMIDPNCRCDCGDWFRRHQACPNCPD